MPDKPLPTAGAEDRNLHMCRFCHQEFSESENESGVTTCCRHPGFFVCRYHPNNAAASGDGLGYYGSGDVNDNWEAKFWDCCGSEDPHAPGCIVAKHASFDCEIAFGNI